MSASMLRLRLPMGLARGASSLGTDWKAVTEIDWDLSLGSCTHTLLEFSVGGKAAVLALRPTQLARSKRRLVSKHWLEGCHRMW